MSFIKFRSVSKRLASLIALSLNLDDNFFERIGAWDVPTACVRLLHYPGIVIKFILSYANTTLWSYP